MTMEHWNYEMLRALPTLHQGQCCDCKIDSNGLRVWICRVAGGVTVEQYDTKTGRWNVVSGTCNATNS
jgi:hypothetical protein